MLRAQTHTEAEGGRGREGHARGEAEYGRRYFSGVRRPPSIFRQASLLSVSTKPCPLQPFFPAHAWPAPGAVRPVFTYPTHSRGGCAITGGYIVRDPGVPDLLGRYVYADCCRGQLRSIRLRAGGSSGDAAIPGVPTVPRLSSFGQDARGRVYAVSQSGPVYRFAAR